MWGLQRGISVIPRSVKPERIRANFELDGWSLDDNEMTTLNSVKEYIKVCGDGLLPIRCFSTMINAYWWWRRCGNFEMA